VAGRLAQKVHDVVQRARRIELTFGDSQLELEEIDEVRSLLGAVERLASFGEVTFVDELRYAAQRITVVPCVGAWS
jgi:hypothetical protein